MHVSKDISLCLFVSRSPLLQVELYFYLSFAKFQLHLIFLSHFNCIVVIVVCILPVVTTDSMLIPSCHPLTHE
jgi:hypothetical protein